MEPRNYLVATVYTNPESGKVSTMSETFHADIDAALAEYTNRGGRDVIICKVLTVKTVLVDFDIAGSIEKDIR